MRGLGKGHGDAHPFMPQNGTEAPAAGTSCAAACIAFDVHHQPLKFHTKGNKGATLGWKRLQVVVVGEGREGKGERGGGGRERGRIGQRREEERGGEGWEREGGRGGRGREGGEGGVDRYTSHVFFSCTLHM